MFFELLNRIRNCLRLLAYVTSFLELTEFVLQLDEEVEAMQASVLHLDLQMKEAKNSELTSPRDHASSSKESKERTKGTTNGPVDTAPGSLSSSNSSTKT